MLKTPRWKCDVCVLVITSLLANSGIAGETGTDWEGRFRAEYPAAAQNLRRSLDNLVAKGTMSSKNERANWSADVEFSRLGDLAKCDMKYSDREELKCFSSEKSFYLERHDDKAKWIVRQVFGPYGDDRRAKPSRFFQVDRYCNALFAAFEDQIDEWIADPTVVVDYVHPRDANASSDQMRVIVRTHTPTPKFEVDRIEVTLAPSMSWSICAFKIERVSSGEMVSSVTIGNVQPREWNGVWFPEKVEFLDTTVTRDGKTWNGRREFICQKVEVNGPIQPADFEMRSYSLPDLDPIPETGLVESQGRSKWLLWLSINLAMIAVIAVVAINRARTNRSSKDTIVVGQL